MRQIVQVKKSRAWGHATVDLVNKDGSIESRDKTLVVKFPVDAQEVAKEGSLWEISGKEYLKKFSVNGFVVNEYIIDGDEIKFLRPSGKILARWLSANIKGIGTVIAKRLVRVKNLAELIESRDKGALLEISGMSEERVERLLEQWPAPNLYKTIEWLEKQQLPLNLGDKLVGIFGADAIEKVKTHPFLLMAMGVSFEKTMAMANELKLSMTDNAVMAGVALHVAVKHSAETGSTVIDAKTLVGGCTDVMKSKAPATIGDVAVEEGYLVKAGNAFQVYGKALMESTVAQFLVDAYKRRPGAHALLAGWEKDMTRYAVEKAVLEYESSLGFALTNEQRMAVVGAVMSPVCCISGGAGTGKTTILKAVLGVYDLLADGMPCYQVALSGRAAQKMASSTGAPAQTIAKLIANHAGDKKPDLPPHLLLVVDEASMVDLLSMYRLVSLLPSATRILFVGDTSQLPPVGDGLVFHALFGTPIQFFNLSQVKRQSDQSGIHRFATGIRESKLEMPRRTQASCYLRPRCLQFCSQRTSRPTRALHVVFVPVPVRQMHSLS
jgi:exodeoxyribonuclease V alpha subunit